MALFRNLGPFRTTAIGHGEMPLTIENNRGHDVGIETLHASLDAGCRHIDTAFQSTLSMRRATVQLDIFVRFLRRKPAA